MEEITPIVRVGGGWAKRDDLFEVASVNGGKARACLRLAQGAAGLVVGAGRSSAQAQIVARLAQAQGIPCRWHTATGPDTPETADAEARGCEVIRHTPGYGSVLTARAAADAVVHGYRLIPYGLGCRTATDATRGQVRDIPDGVLRIVVAVGSGTNVAGILWGLQDTGLAIPVVGVRVGGDPTKHLDRLAPRNWHSLLTIVQSPYKYGKAVYRNVRGIPLDPYYEAKVCEFLRRGDLFWIIGRRVDAATKPT